MRPTELVIPSSQDHPWGTQVVVARHPPVMQVEMDGYCRKFGIETHDFIAELADDGYDTGYYDEPANQIVYTQRPWEQRIVNVLAISRVHRSEVDARLGAKIAQIR